MQGCVLLPVLFSILLEVVIALALENNEIGATISGNLISNLRFADDICLVATSRDVVLGTCTCTRVVLDYRFEVLVLVVVLEA